MNHRFTDGQIAHMQGLLDHGLISDYYAFQRHYGRSYADFAPNVYGNSTFKGRMAVNFLKAGIGDERAEEIHGKLANDLAQADLDKINEKLGEFPTQNEIEEYHAKVFEDKGVPLEAFGGGLYSQDKRNWLDLVVDDPSDQEMAGGNSSAFDGINTKKADDNFTSALGRTLRESAFKDWSKGGTTTKHGSVVNEGAPLGSTVYVDASKEPMPLPKPRRRKPLPENPRFLDYFDYEDDDGNGS